jgi:hypothetical protein
MGTTLIFAGRSLISCEQTLKILAFHGTLTSARADTELLAGSR